MIVIKDKSGNIVAEVPEEMFPLSMPLKIRQGDKEYFIRIFYEEDGTPRSALMNTKK